VKFKNVEDIIRISDAFPEGEGDALGAAGRVGHAFITTMLIGRLDHALHNEAKQL